MPDTGTRSSEHSEPLRLDKKPLAEVFAGGVMAAGEGAHKVLARYPDEVREGLWLIDDEDEAARIAKPLAKVAERHAGGDLGVTSDVNDLLTAGLYVVAYVFRNTVRAWQIRRAARQMQAFGIDPDGPTEGDPQ